MNKLMITLLPILVLAVVALGWIEPWDLDNPEETLHQLTAEIPEPARKLDSYELRLTQNHKRFAEHTSHREINLYPDALERIARARESLAQSPDSPAFREAFGKAWHLTRAALMQFKTVQNRLRGADLQVDIDAVLQRLEQAQSEVSTYDPKQVANARRTASGIPVPEPSVSRKLEEQIRALRGDHLAITKTERGMIVSVADILFEVGKSTLTGNLMQNLDKIAAVCTTIPEARILIEGHTDNRGTAKANRRLSLERARAVKNYLIEKGISSDRLIAEGHGAQKPVASNKTEDGRRKNRRVDLIITTEK